MNRTGGLLAVGLAGLVIGAGGPVVAATGSAVPGGPAATDRPAVTDKPVVPVRPVVPSRPAVPGKPLVTDRPAAAGSPAVRSRPAAGDSHHAAGHNPRPASSPDRPTARPSAGTSTASPSASASSPGRPASRLVRLQASIATQALPSGIVRYTVTVRAIGGVAYGAALEVTAGRPASWASFSPRCVSNDSVTVLSCPLGELTGTRSFQMSAAANGPGSIGVAASVSAANTVAHSVATVTVIDPPAKSTAHRAHSKPHGRWARTAGTQGPVSKPHGHKPGSRLGTSSQTGESAPPPAADYAAPAPFGVVPSTSAALTSTGTTVAPPAVSPNAVLPNITAPNIAAPKAAVPAGDHAEGASEMTMFTPERSLATDRRSWATVIALAVVAETALLWLAIGRAMWRRGLVHLPRLGVPGAVRSLAGNVSLPKFSARRPVFPWRRLRH